MVNLQYNAQRVPLLGGWTGVAARAIGKIMAMVLANIIPGHLADRGRLSEIQEFRRAVKIVMMLI